MSPRVSFVPAAYSRSARMPPPLVIADVGVDGLARRVGDQVADRGLLAPDRGAARVERASRSCRSRSPAPGRACPDRSCTTAAISGSGSTPIVSTMSNSGVQLTLTLPSFSVLSSVMVVTTTWSAWLSEFRQHGAAVVEDDQMLVVAGEDEVGEAFARQLHVLRDAASERRRRRSRRPRSFRLACFAFAVSTSSAKVMSPGDATSGVSAVVRP